MSAEDERGRLAEHEGETNDGDAAGVFIKVVFAIGLLAIVAILIFLAIKVGMWTFG